MIRELTVVLLLLSGAVLGAPALAVDINVDTAVDESDGSCMDGDCSLRDAIAVAASGDRVVVPAGNYNLTIGALEPTVSLSIVGAGAQSTIVDGGGNSSVFAMDTAGLDVTIESLTVTNGQSGRGGGIAARNGTLTLRDCVVSNSSAFNGGGVSYDSGALIIERCAIIDNLADGNSGAGILASGADLTLLDSTVAGNSAPATGRVGGGVAVFGQLLTRGSPPIGNAIIRNSTIVDNDAEDTGGGIYVPSGGGAFVEISNTVIANNAGGDCSETMTSLGYNLDSDGSCGLGATGDQPSTAPDLAPRALNGGETPNYLPNATSPLVDGGNPSGLDGGPDTCTARDQRGLYPATVDGCDIGSTELNGVPNPPVPGPGAQPVPVPSLQWIAQLLLSTLVLGLALIFVRRA